MNGRQESKVFKYSSILFLANKSLERCFGGGCELTNLRFLFQKFQLFFFQSLEPVLEAAQKEP